MVLDLEAMEAIPGSWWKMGSEQSRSVGSLEATGERETVAGMVGEVDRLERTDHGGNTREDEVVLTEAPRAKAPTRALQRMSAASGRAIDPVGEAMLAEGQGLLRFVDRFRVESIADEVPPASVFELPAEPMDMQQLMQGLGG